MHWVDLPPQLVFPVPVLQPQVLGQSALVLSQIFRDSNGKYTG